MLYVLKTMRQTILAKWHARKNVQLIHPHHKKKHFLHPLHCLLIRLSFVSNTFLLRNHIKNIFRHSFNFHNYLVGKCSWKFIRSLYIDLTENIPNVVSLQTNLSGSSFNCIIIRRLHKCIHESHFVPSKRISHIYLSLDVLDSI
jgi:hypothetical protein